MLSELLPDPDERRRFLRESYLRIPFSRAGSGVGLRELGTLDVVRAILGSGSADVVVARGGKPFEGPIPSDPDALLGLHRDGWTLTLRHAERHHETLGARAKELEEELGAPADIHVTCTPRSERGFGWHYDVEEVFLVQLAGVKDYQVRRNTVLPWAVRSGIPRDLGYERESSPVMACTLHPGDWLYVPAGWWHAAAARTDAISLAAGLMAPVGLDVLEVLSRLLRHSLVWRRRLPALGTAAGSPEEIERALRATLGELHRDLGMELEDGRLLRELIQELTSRR